MVEFGFCVVFVIFLTMGMIQYGLIANTYNTLNQIAREGARQAAVYGKGVGGLAQCNDSTYIIGAATSPMQGTMHNKCMGSSVQWSDIVSNITITPANGSLTSSTCNTARVSGFPISVTIKYNMVKKIFVPLPPDFPGLGALNTTVSVTSTMVIE